MKKCSTEYRSLLFASFATVMVGLLSGTAIADIALVTNPDNIMEGITVSQVKNLYLGKTHRLPSGEFAMLIDQKEGSAVRESFGNKILNMNPSKLASYWAARVFSGKGVPPPLVNHDEDVKAWIAKTPNGIGYIDSSAVDSTIKVLLTVH